MADIGQDKESLEIKKEEVEIRILQKQQALANLEIERKSSALNIKRLEKKLNEYDSSVEEINKQIELDRKDLESLDKALNK